MAPLFVSTIPVVREGVIRRLAVLDRLALTTQPLVLLVAPPGYGKTTALAQWIERDGRAVVWIIVEEADNDPNRLLDRLAAGLPASEARARRGEPTVSSILREIRSSSATRILTVPLRARRDAGEREARFSPGRNKTKGGR